MSEYVQKTPDEIEEMVKEGKRMRACNYKQAQIAKLACNGLLWLVEQDRITIDKAYETVLAAEGWGQIDYLQEELLTTGRVSGVHNPNDLFIVPGGLETVDEIDNPEVDE